jgi:Zn finger protein HypA/HybF involved in hydrogenase expression
MKAGTKEYYTEYYQKNKEKHNAKMKEWQIKENYKSGPAVKKWKEKNSELVKKWDRDRKKKNTQERREFINEYKSKCSCSKCGETRPYVLDFHHIDPIQKSFDLGDASKHSIEKLKLELEKCITLCRNCHSEFHYFEKEQGITINEYLK